MTIERFDMIEEDILNIEDLEPGTLYMYRESGGVNWCLCKVIAIYGKKVWLVNYYTGTQPVKHFNRCKFRNKPEDIL